MPTKDSGFLSFAAFGQVACQQHFEESLGVSGADISKPLHPEPEFVVERLQAVA